MDNWNMVSPDVAAVMGVVDTVMQWKRLGSHRSYIHYHPSEFGKCLRKMDTSIMNRLVLLDPLKKN